MATKAKKPARKKAVKAPKIANEVLLPEPVVEPVQETVEIAASPDPVAKAAPKLKSLAAELAVPRDIKAYQLALCFVGSSDHRLFGLSCQDRLRRQFAKGGLTEEISQEALAGHRGPVLLVRSDALIDQPLIDVLLKKPNLALTTEESAGETMGRKIVAANLRADDAMAFASAVENNASFKRFGVVNRAPGELEANFWKALRKRETPYALVVSAENLEASEWRMFMGTYKGATDLVTKHVWPRPAFAVTRWLAPRGITPNMVTTVGAIMTVLAFVLFLYGQFAWGLAAAWAMTFLDTVDGKLARTTLTSSKWGDVFDHGIDLVHPPFWYAAWALGLSAWGISWSATLFWWILAVILGGYVVQRLMEGISIKWLGLEIHIWRRIDTYFRQITARRNPNLILLTIGLLAGKPDWGLIAVAAWTAICLVLHGAQLMQALATKNKTGPLESWMTKP